MRCLRLVVFRDKKLRGALLAFIGVHGNAATRLGAFGLIPDYFYSAPHEDARLKGK